MANWYTNTEIREHRVIAMPIAIDEEYLVEAARSEHDMELAQKAGKLVLVLLELKLAVDFYNYDDKANHIIGTTFNVKKDVEGIDVYIKNPGCTK